MGAALVSCVTLPYGAAASSLNRAFQVLASAGLSFRLVLGVEVYQRRAVGVSTQVRAQAHAFTPRSQYGATSQDIA